MKASIRLDRYTTRLIDLGDSVGVVSQVEPDGSLVIYLNSRWPEAKRESALNEELDYLRRTTAKPKEEKKAVTNRYIKTMDGRSVNGPMPVFHNSDIKRIGRGVYMPTMMNVGKLMLNMDAMRPVLRDICLYYDIRQTVPHLPVERLKDATGGLDWSAVKFIGWAPSKTALPALAHFETDSVLGTIYYRIDGSIDCITIAINVEHDGHVFAITAHVLRKGHGLSIGSIYRSIDDQGYSQIY